MNRALAAGHPLFGLGFRPFFLGAGAFAVLAVALWAASFLGWLPIAPRGGALAWHLHEMTFGFACAVIGGFLLTAVQNWTNSPGLRGAPLAALFGLWLAARIGWLWPALPWPLLAGLELAFLPALAARLGWQLGRAGQRRNYPLVALLALLTLADAVATCAVRDNDFALLRQAVWAALWLIGAVIALIGARVIPLFTANGLGLPPPAPVSPWEPRLAMGGFVLLAALAGAGAGLAPEPWFAPLLLALALLHARRVVRWYRPGIWRVPLLWSLHVAYAWLALALLALAAWHAGAPVVGSAALHAFTVGTVGGLTLAMMARVSLGHTGRSLTPPRAIAIAFAAVALAAAARAGLVGVAPRLGVTLAAVAWCLGFGVFVVCYAPMLWRARVDGRPG